MIINTRPTLIGFLADKNGSAQGSINNQTDTAITFGTERFDIGAAFASNVWTPPAGKVSLYAAVSVTGTISANAIGILGIWKNGANFAYVQKAATTNAYSITIVIEDIANGSDYYGVNVWLTGTNGMSASGTSYLTYFGGHRFSL